MQTDRQTRSALYAFILHKSCNKLIIIKESIKYKASKEFLLSNSMVQLKHVNMNTKQDEKFNVDFVFSGYTDHISLTQSMIMNSLRAVSSRIASRGCYMDCASSTHLFRSDVHLGLWGGTFHMSSVKQIYASVLSSYTRFLMSMRYVPGDLACNLTESGYAAGFYYSVT
jgi:hypothetical protein